MKNLTDQQKDVLKETINISIGKAAATFNKMINEHIELSVPEIQFVTSGQALDLLKIDGEVEVCYVEQHFDGKYFNSHALLVFTEHESLELVKLFLGSGEFGDEMTSLEVEAMNEIGNIILNASIGSLSNILSDQINSSLPVCIRTRAKNIFTRNRVDETNMMLLIFVDFGVESKKINGYIVLILKLTSFEEFIDKLTQGLIS